MARTIGSFSLTVCVAAGAAMMAQAADGPPTGGGQQYGTHGGGSPVYQRRAFDWGSKGIDRRCDGFNQRVPFAPQVSSGWFQRPYPYHLDYYKMRYGGSYAPYFGNLYGTPFGTPQVVNGGWGHEAGGWGGSVGLPPQGYEWMDGSGVYAYPPASVAEQPGQVNGASVQNGSEQKASESLPAPQK